MVTLFGNVNSAVPPVNAMLKSISVPVKLHEGLNISMDCSLSSNIAVTSHSTDTALKVSNKHHVTVKLKVSSELQTKGSPL